MKRAHAALGALAAVLLLTGVGTTDARFHAVATATTAPVVSGSLGVSVEARGADLDALAAPGRSLENLEPGATGRASFVVRVGLTGDNARAALTLDVPAWAAPADPALDVVAVGIDAPALGLVDHPPGTGAPVAWVVPAGSTWTPPDGLPVVADGTELAVDVHLAVDPAAGNAYQGLALPAAELVADLRLERRASTTSWHATGSAPLPAAGLGTVTVDLHAAARATAPPGEPEPAEPEAPSTAPVDPDGAPAADPAVRDEEETT